MRQKAASGTGAGPGPTPAAGAGSGQRRDWDRKPEALDVAFRFLGYRPRSEFEIRAWLRRKGFAPPDVEATISALKSRGLVDDVAFARYWKESRDSASPRSRAALRSELARKGIDREVADGVLAGADDEAAAYRASRKKAARLAGCDYTEFRNRLAAALRRRGFSYEVTEHTVKRLWQESRSHG